MLEAINELPERFTASDMVAWFGRKYPKIQANTIRLHLRSASANVPQDPHQPDWQERPLGSKLFKLDRSTYTQYRPEVHGAWDHGRQVGVAEGEDGVLQEPETTGEDADELPPSQFALEAHLEEFMEANWSRIDFGRPLAIWRGDDGETGRQYSTGVGTIDFLCVDTSTGQFVVVELKRGRSSDRVVGQCLRYMGWVRQHLADGKPISGIIIAHEHDEQLKYAVAEVPALDFMSYKIDFQLIREPIDD